MLSIVSVVVGAGLAQPTQAELDLEHSYATMLFHLALERFAENSKRDEIWVICLRASASGEIQKYSDGKFTVVSIPVLSFEEQGMSCYAAHYHGCNLGLGAGWCRERKFDDARRLFRLMQKFSSEPDIKRFCESGVQMLDRISAGANAAQEVEKFQTSLKDYFASSEGALDRLRQVKPLTTTNLLDLRIENLITNSGTNAR